jgi:hypothetical protein
MANGVRATGLGSAMPSRVSTGRPSALLPLNQGSSQEEWFLTPFSLP